MEGPRGWEVLRYAPFLMPFEERATVFHMVVAADKEQAHGRMAMMIPGHGRLVTIHRARVLEDAFDQLYSMGASLKVCFGGGGGGWGEVEYCLWGVWREQLNIYAVEHTRVYTLVHT